MIRAGGVCSTCHGSCEKRLNVIECPICGGQGTKEDKPCEHCKNGAILFEPDECPQDYIASLVQPIRLAAMCGSGDWPVTGGLLDQAAWFVALKQTLEAEHNKIEHEKLEKLKNGS